METDNESGLALRELSANAAPSKPWKVRLFLTIFGYAAILVFAWRSIDRDGFLAGLRQLGFADIATVLAVAILHIAGRATRYHWLVTRSNPNGSYHWYDGFRIFLVGLSASAVTPARAGDFIKAQLVKKYGLGFHVGFGLVMVERMLDLLVITSYVVVVGTLLAEGSTSHAWRTGSIVLLLTLIAGTILLSIKGPRNRAIAILGGLISRIRKGRDQGKLVSTLTETFEVWDSIFASPLTFARYTIYSAGVWGVEFLKLWLVLRLIHSPVDLKVALFAYPVSIIAGIVSVVPFSEGVVGMTGVALLTSMGHVDSGASTIAIVVDRAASSLPPLLLWAGFALVAGRRANLSK